MQPNPARPTVHTARLATLWLAALIALLGIVALSAMTLPDDARVAELLRSFHPH